MSEIVVIGAGQAGAALVARLRDEGFDGAITLVGAESVPPYQRPPLSKAYLLGEMGVERLYLRPESYYADHDIALRLGTPVREIDRKSKRVILRDRTKLSYDMLALTTGAVPRRLPSAFGGDLEGVFTVRDLDDVDAMAPYFEPGARVLVVGGGYIGLEGAAVAAKKGLDVTLVEVADRILKRVAAPETSDYFRALHRAHGVRVLESTPLVRLEQKDGRVTGARIGDGSLIEVDVVIVGIGVAPRTELAESAGLVIDNGIAVDARGRTSDPSIWAAGDCTSFPFRGTRIRLESVQNAIDQAEAVASNMLGKGADYVPEPWFWSDQYDVKLQIAGLNTGYDRLVVRKDGAAQSHWYYRNDTLLSVDAMNDSRAYMVGKRLISMGKSPPPDLVADPATELKPLLKA